ncbi:ABC transporter ATP-binding protein [Actinospica sp. MGRD01-02]|uniref:ABC transporter ATP-binding protein n=1 Tax=Actinospica acidithermotolerans TaxID=2828514 RepID=A0A941IN88_9ACTN|nr:ABC transporter ATP-binding protein [Actinospica acidithermotolerans]MBR7830788.1 ABC transporter ATP-binding protein [Actinospica acidithermotolerans]
MSNEQSGVVETRIERSDASGDETGIDAREVFRRFESLARKDRALMVLACVLATVAAAAEAGVVLVFMVITDDVLETRNLHAFWHPAVMWIGATLLGAAAMFGRDLLTSLASERFLLRLRDKVFRHVQSMSPTFFSSRDTGDLVARITGDIDAVENLVIGGVVALVSDAAGVLMFAGTAIYLRWDLALVSFAVAPLFWLVTRGFAKPFAEASRRERAGNGAIAAVVEENVQNMMLVQAYNRPSSERDRVHAAGVEWLRARMAEARLAALYGPVVLLTETVCVLAVLGVGAWELSENRIGLSGLLAFAAFLGMLYPPIQSMSGFGVLKATAGAGAQRLLDVLEERPAVADLAQTGMYQARGGWVEFDSVTFRYPGQDRGALRDVSLVAAPGRLVLVTGSSGAGKSTLTQLLLRFHDPESGSIRLDGTDIRDLTLRRLRSNVTLMLQQTMLFDGTVRENIAYGDPTAGDERIEDAARRADAADFIDALPQGYDTIIGQGGSSLSGGQRQRLAIARALLRDTPVLVLDEPTTGLDAVAARKVLDPLRRLMSGRTTILISHDLHLAHDADEILVVDAGRIVQRGRHDELTAVRGKYAELWEAQNGGVPEGPAQKADTGGGAEAQPSLWRPAPA